MPKWSKARVKGALLLLLTFLGGCAEPSFQSRYNDYTERLARVLEQDIGPLNAVAPLPYPEQRRVQLPIPAVDIDLLDFLRLGDCQLQGVVADKNSSLGRFAGESKKLWQDVLFIVQVEQCLALVSDEELRQKLISARDLKLTHLDARLWNAIFAGPEYRAYWRNDQKLYPHVAESQLQGALNVLHHQSEVLLQKSALEQFDAEQFEQALEVLRSGEAAALMSSWQITRVHLDQASAVILSRTASRPLCFKNMQNQKAEFFRNVVIDKFNGGLQRDIAVLSQRYYEVVQPTQALEALFQHIETPHYRQYRIDRDRAFEQGLASVVAHVEAIKPLMIQCGFMPAT